MKHKLCLFILIAFFSNSAMAEYYLVYAPPRCYDCAQDFYPVRHIKHHRRHPCKRHHYVRKHRACPPCAMARCIRRQSTNCGTEEACTCSGGYVVQFAQPRFPGEYCTTYADIVQGQSEDP